ncbi:MAG: phosphatase PAP2 family protein [Candidatus Shapirobacteria bacterium]|jgi:membrane-associated phospholipid phosphatase
MNQKFFQKHKFLFWQPTKDYLKIFDHSVFGEIGLIILNYSIWVFFFFISYLLIRYDINFFGRLFLITLVAEFIERYLKKQKIWIRPMFHRRSVAPNGLVNSWYYSGSFPSGHTIKMVYFLLFVIVTQVISIPLFLAITIPLLTFRVITGFHYPIDILGGIIFGLILWFLSKGIIFPDFLNNFIQPIFNFIFGL